MATEKHRAYRTSMGYFHIIDCTEDKIKTHTTIIVSGNAGLHKFHTRSLQDPYKFSTRSPLGVHFHLSFNTTGIYSFLTFAIKFHTSLKQLVKLFMCLSLPLLLSLCELNSNLNIDFASSNTCVCSSQKSTWLTSPYCLVNPHSFCQSPTHPHYRHKTVNNDLDLENSPSMDHALILLEWL